MVVKRGELARRRAPWCMALIAVTLASMLSLASPLSLFALPRSVPPRRARLARLGPARNARGGAIGRNALPAVGAGVKSIWAASGVGPVLLAAWAKLAPYPPFSWMLWFVHQIAGAPKLYRYYIYYSFGNSLAKWLVPGIHAQIMTGTWLGLLKTVNPGAYADNVANRLRMLLIKQAKLKSGPGRQPELPKEALDLLCQRLKEDKVLVDVLGSTAVLGMWHKLERTPLDSPKLLNAWGAQSQERWVLEALNAGYYGDVQALASQSGLAVAAQNAATKMKALREAVDAAQFSAQQGVMVSGSAGLLAQVDKASTDVASALHELGKAKEEAQKSAAGQAASDDAAAWQAKLKELQAAYAGMPAVAAELKRLESE
eukprot:TRINITY_DN76920_c0_g1_i1.p1 TRINITY_DN76920_c0_g1~~TRINITY_DN76920_c0_g1_i1.p1  ORF type:complete len:372 (+),score=92.39 TRINITY_DN76920_c0_g1_i1:33-1148(+)